MMEGEERIGADWELKEENDGRKWKKKYKIG